MEDIADLIKLLSLDSPAPVRSAAMEYCLGVTASRTEGLGFFKTNESIVPAIIEVTGDEKYSPIAKDAWLALVNIAAMKDDKLMAKMIEGDVVEKAVAAVMNKDIDYADEVCMFLGNATRHKDAAAALVACGDTHPASEGEHVLRKLCDIFCQGPAYNPNAKFHYLGHALFNVSQMAEARTQIMLRAGEGCLLQRILPFSAYEESIIRRGGAIGCIRNCCFSSSDHEWLLGDEVAILPHLMLPLVGPEELEEDEMENMPDELQYQPPDKTREEDADLRKMLLESLLQLCASQIGRKTLRDSNIYHILKHYHLWEPEEDVRDMCTEVVEVLITPEMEDELPEGVDNLRDLEVPDRYTKTKEEIENELTQQDAKDEKPKGEETIFHVGAPEGYEVKWRPDPSVVL